MRLFAAHRLAARVLCIGAVCVPAQLEAQCPDGTPPPCAARPARAAAPPATSVAVLYFDNLSRDTADAYVADGLTEELITRLGQLERLQVKSRTAVQRYRGRPIDDPTALGRTLSVAHLVSGSVRRGGGRLRVIVELTRASTGVRVWGNSYERGADDLMAIETDIAQAIAEGVGGHLAPAERRSLAARPTSNPTAYDHLLRGNFYLARRTGTDAGRALAEYEAAARIDPSLARAWARIGLTYKLFLDWNWPWPGLTEDSLLSRGFVAADRALAADSNNSDAWMVRGLLLAYRAPATHEGVVPALQRAVQLDPRNAEAWHQLGDMLSVEMRGLDTARRAHDRALALDPQRMITLTNTGKLLYFWGRATEALQMVDSAVAANPDHFYPRVIRGWIRLQLRNLAGARADVEAAERLRGVDNAMMTEALSVAVLAAQGDSAAARIRAEGLTRMIGESGSLRHGPTAFYVATALLASGQRDRAMATLERARATGNGLWYAMQDPALASLRGDPRYERLRAEVRPPWAH